MMCSLTRHKNSNHECGAPELGFIVCIKKRFAFCLLARVCKYSNRPQFVKNISRISAGCWCASLGEAARVTSNLSWYLNVPTVHYLWRGKAAPPYAL